MAKKGVPVVGFDLLKDQLKLTGKKCSDFISHFFKVWDMTVIARKYLEECGTGEHHELVSVLRAIEDNMSKMSDIMFEDDKENVKKVEKAA